MNEEDYNIIDSRFPWILRGREFNKENLFDITVELMRYVIIYKNIDEIIVSFYKEYMKRKNDDSLNEYFDTVIQPFVKYLYRVHTGETSLLLPKEEPEKKKKRWFCF